MAKAEDSRRRRKAEKKLEANMTRLAIDPKTPPRVKQLIKSLEDHYFSDVHTMLRLPRPNHGLPAGCTFAIAQVLAAAVSGISVTLYSHTGLRVLLKDFYPWSLEPEIRLHPKTGQRLFCYPKSAHPRPGPFLLRVHRGNAILFR